MNGLKKLTKGFKGKNKTKNLIISIVILIEVISLLTVATFAWVETVSSIKLTNKNDEAYVDTYVFTRAMIGGTSGTIDLGKYFKQGGDMHLSPGSSADGKTFYFPQKASATTYSGAGTGNFRKGTISDKNTVYMSATFKLRADTNADFFFTQVPSFSNNGGNIRVSVTAYSEGADPDTHIDQATGQTVSNTTIYALNKLTASSNSVINSTYGGTAPTAVEAFGDHDIDGRTHSDCLFSVGAEETKIVTINLWLQGTTMSSNLASDIVISNLGLKSDLTPRHVTLIPTPTWDQSNTTEYFYAWCWGATNGDSSRLYGPMTLDENEHYSFDYNGTYQSTLFIRSPRSDLTKENLDTQNHWNDSNYVWNRTVDTSIPVSPVDPTYVIQTINEGTDGKSTGSWLLPAGPVSIHLAYTTTPASQSDMGSISATTYIGTSTSTHVMEQTNNTAGSLHHTTIHGWSGNRLKLSATAKTVNGNAQYQFVGWYDNPEGLNNGTDKHLLSTNANYDFNISASSGDEVTYYAKFKEVRKITVYKYLDGASSSANIGTYKINTTKSGTTATYIQETVDYGSSVTLSYTSTTGYSLDGFYTVQSAGTAITPVTTSGTTKSVTITADGANFNTIYYLRVDSNTHTVTANAYYSTNNGTSYSAGSTGGTVKAGETAAGATSAASVKYKKTVQLVAAPKTGYEFVGWFSSTSATSALSTSTSYTYTLNDDQDVDVYARFKYAVFNVTANAYYTNDGSTYYAGDNGGTVEAGTDDAGATSTDSVMKGNSIKLQAHPAQGYKFVGWFSSTSATTSLSNDATYYYVLNSNNNVDVYARFKKMDTVHLKHDGNWDPGELMTTTDSGNYVCSIDVPEGGFKFKVYNDTTSTWYGKNNTTQTDEGTISSLSSSGADINLQVHAGNYTFTYSQTNNTISISRNHYNNITITLDSSSTQWIGDASAIVWFDCDQGSALMTKNSNSNWTVSVPSNYATGISFKRNNPGNSTTWNSWNAGSRGYKTTYKTSGDGTGSWP